MASQKGPQRATSPVSPSTFESLPTEIRLKVYSHIFPPPGKYPLRCPSHLIDQNAPLNTAIFATNKAIYAEIVPEFYGKFTFHIELDSFNINSSIPECYLPFVKHTSADMMHLSDGHSDAVIAQYVLLLNEHCTALKTCTLHLIPRRFLYDYQQSEGQWLKRSAKQLQTLQTRLDRFTIVTVVERLAWLRREINKDDDAWVTEVFPDWPHLNLTGRQQLRMGLKSQGEPHDIGSGRFTAFHIYEPSVARRMKEGKYSEPGDWAIA